MGVYSERWISRNVLCRGKSTSFDQVGGLVFDLLVFVADGIEAELLPRGFGAALGSVLCGGLGGIQPVGVDFAGFGSALGGAFAGCLAKIQPVGIHLAGFGG